MPFLGNPLIVITGVAPFSLGEQIVRQISTNRVGANILGVDISHNPRLNGLKGYRELKADLNPFGHSGGFRAFSSNIEAMLESCLDGANAAYIEVLIQSAGIYDAGAFLEADQNKRERILGVNFLGHIEVLHAAMRLNSKRGFSNPTHLRYLDVGSFQGLHARKHRSLYAVSKAAMIDMCTSLAEGNEIRRCIYLAPCPIDTHMLHKNHWVQKAAGSIEIFEAAIQESLDTYEGIFRACDRVELSRLTNKMGHNEKEALSALEAYAAERRAAYGGSLGVLSPEVCAEVVAGLVINERFCPSGVYSVSPTPTGRADVQYAGFGDLARQDSMIRAGSRIDPINGEA